MATLTELYNAPQSSAFRINVTAAVVIKATLILGETAGTNLALRQRWAGNALANPDAVSKSVMNGVLGVNSAAAIGAITGAADSVIQTAVNTVCDTLANYGP